MVHVRIVNVTHDFFPQRLFQESECCRPWLAEAVKYSAKANANGWEFTLVYYRRRALSTQPWMWTLMNALTQSINSADIVTNARAARSINGNWWGNMGSLRIVHSSQYC